MKTTMVVPSYWRRKKEEGWKSSDTVYDHPTPLDEEGTLGRLLESLSVLDNKDFELVVLGVADASDIQDAVEEKLTSLIGDAKPKVRTHLFSYSHLRKIHIWLESNNHKELIPLLQLDGYSNVRNLCLFLPHILGSDTAVLIDDDEIFTDSKFMDKAGEFIGQKFEGKDVLAVAGYYINPDNDFLLNKEILPWETHWNKIDCMNRAFNKAIATPPRLKVTTFAFGGNLVIHRDLFTRVPFDPSVPRGEDIDYLMNARMFGFEFFLDNQLSIRHEAPPKTFPLWQQVREDIIRFLFEKFKLDTQEPQDGMAHIKAEDLDPYPGEFLKDDLYEQILYSNQMLAIDYLSRGEPDSAQECLKNIQLANSYGETVGNPFRNLCRLQKKWQKLMDVFSQIEAANDAVRSLDVEN